jgi:putative colanic acid biosynthesis acetyltransferase WcaF
MCPALIEQPLRQFEPTPCEFQDLEQFRVPPGFRGRSGPVVLLWQIVQSTLFAMSPRPLYGWRRALLRLFGAKIGRKVLVRPSACIAFPWKLEVGDFSWIGDHVDLYNLDRIYIGCHSVISQRSYLCTASHDVNDIAFSYITGPIVVADEVWVASDVFVAPGVTIGRGAVVGMRSLVLDDIPPEQVAFGQPAKARGRRLKSKASSS